MDKKKFDIKQKEYDRNFFKGIINGKIFIIPKQNRIEANKSTITEYWLSFLEFEDQSIDISDVERKAILDFMTERIRNDRFSEIK